MSISASSSFRRYGRHDDRRRRLLADELYEPGGGATCRVWPDDDLPRRKSERYGDAEFLDRQWRLLDLVPRRPIVPAALFSALAAGIVGLEFAYGWMTDRAAAGAARIAALDLAAKGNLACWFSSLMLLAAAIAALMVLAVRRHRTDDYQGRYRVWGWAAAGCAFFAADQAAPLRDAIRETMLALTGTPLLGNGEVWWLAPYAIAFGAIGSRALLDMRSCIAAATAFSGGAAAHGLALAMWFGWIPFGDGTDRVMLQSGLEMSGNLLLLAALTLFARHVVLDAEGLLPARRRAEPDDRPGEEGEFHSAGPGRWRKIDAPHAAPQPSYQRPPAPAALPAKTAPPAPATTPAPISRKLTKGERKALKARLLRERMERERKCG